MHTEESLLALAAAGRSAWPELEIDEAIFVRHLERHLGAASDRAAALARIRADDLYLACACAEGKSAAILAFERRFAGVIDRAVARFGRTDDRRAELRQILLERLFVAPPGARARIASYGGQGFLENWLRVAAMRAFINAEPTKKPEASGDEVLAVLADGRDLELDFLKVHYRAAFRVAFARGLALLDPAERLVLRLAVLDGLGCDGAPVPLSGKGRGGNRRHVHLAQASLPRHPGRTLRLCPRARGSPQESADLRHYRAQPHRAPWHVGRARKQAPRGRARRRGDARRGERRERLLQRHHARSPRRAARFSSAHRDSEGPEERPAHRPARAGDRAHGRRRPTRASIPSASRWGPSTGA